MIIRRRWRGWRMPWGRRSSLAARNLGARPSRPQGRRPGRPRSQKHRRQPMKGVDMRTWTLRRFVLLLVTGPALVAAAFWAIDWMRYRFTHSISKDAFVDSHLINVA